MFLLVSKIIWFFLQPSSLLIAAFVASVVLARRAPGTSSRIATIAVICLVLSTVLPLGNILLSPLENRFPRADAERLASAPSGIIVLGGAAQTDIIADRKVLATNHRAERLIEGLLLGRRFPEAKIIVGDHTVHALFVQMGIAETRLIVEQESSNTFENAIFSLQLAAPKLDDVWLLVTSAYHMPRAVGSFRKAGFPVKAWPVDYRTHKEGYWRTIFYRPSTGLRTVDLAAKEWVGMLSYWLTGRLSELYPSP